MTTIIYAVLVFAVVKIYAISVDVSEIKELLRDIKRNTEEHVPLTLGAHAASPESLVRAVHASSYLDSGYLGPEVEQAGDVQRDVAK